MQIYKSSDNGSSWTIKFSYNGQPYEIWGCTKLSFLNSAKGIFIFKNSSFCKLYKTYNGGESWTFNDISFSSGYSPVSCAMVSDSIIIVIMNYPGSGYQIFRSSNTGLNWSINSPPTSNTLSKVYFKNQNLGFIIADSGVIYKTTDTGLLWQVLNTGTDKFYQDISFSDSENGYAVCYYAGQSDIMKTSNGGQNWFLSYTSLNNFRSVSNPKFFTVYVCGHNLIKSSNSGQNWYQIMSTNVTSYVACFNKDSVVVASSNIVYRTFNGGTIIIKKAGEVIPIEYKLFQNFPNPFNPVTKIHFEIPLRKGGEGVVSLKVYDLLGKEISTLVNERLQPGSYEVTFDGSNLPSGVYFYKITAGDFQSVKKMIMLK